MRIRNIENQVHLPTHKTNSKMSLLHSKIQILVLAVITLHMQKTRTGAIYIIVTMQLTILGVIRVRDSLL